MNISFTDQQKKYITDQLASGDFKNVSEVVRDALRLHKFCRYKMLDDLRVEIEKGRSGPKSDRTATQIALKKQQELKK